MYQLKSRQVCLFIIAFFPITKLFVLPSILASFSNENMWISSLISIILDLLTLIPVVYAFKNANAPFFTLVEVRLGKIGSKIIMAIYFIYFSVKLLFPLSEQKDFVETTLYTLSPSIFYFLPFFIVAFTLSLKKLRVIGRCSDLIWLVSLLGIIILLALSVTNADYTAILPIGVKGYAQILKGSFSSLNWFGDVAFLIFFIGEFKYEKNTSLKIFLSYLVSALLIIAFMITFYSIFTSIAFRQRFALTEISKYTTVINDIGRFDYVAISLILFSNLFALSLPLFFCSKILDFIIGKKIRYLSPIICALIHFTLILILRDKLYGLQKLVTGYGGFFFLVMGNILPALSPLLIKKEKFSYEKSKA